MKPPETLFKPKKKYVLVMVLCFLYGGFAILTTIFFVYSFIIRPEFVPEAIFVSRMQPPPDFFGARPPDFSSGTVLDANQLANDSNRFFVRTGSRSLNPVALLSSPLLLLFLTSGLISLAGGFSIWSLVREKEIKSIRQETANNLLLPDEKAIIEALKKSGFESTQAGLSKETGLNKVQVHRAIKRLESKGVLEKHGYGLTNKIILKKEFFE
ncbi:MAG: winged helix-turn-helix transcriptional regulator [Candidatus Diapherotrites archaeon]|nr:winged helix-turn-helix transcriptional regulator [Candidatus Diapherotrites archaeon]